jgi:uncharacterized protein (UPF0297 family)
VNEDFSEIVKKYHPFAQYLGYELCGDEVKIFYQGKGESRCMLIDRDRNIIEDETFGTYRWGTLIASGATAAMLLVNLFGRK